MNVSKQTKKQVVSYLIDNHYGSIEGIDAHKKSLGCFFFFNSNNFDRDGVADYLIGTKFETEDGQPDGQKEGCCSTIDYIEDLEDGAVGLIMHVVQAGAIVLNLEGFKISYRKVGNLIKQIRRVRDSIKNFDAKLMAVGEKMKLDGYYEVTNQFLGFAFDGEDYEVIE